MSNSINLLWTGGLDSTYRLLEIVLQEKKPVQPYYFIDVPRPSLRNELKAIRDIKRKLYNEYPHTRQLLNKVKYIDVDDIQPREVITTNFKALKSIRHLGIQYEWLARFCINNQIAGMELGIIKKGETSEHGEALSESLSPYIEPLSKGSRVYEFADSNTQNNNGKKIDNLYQSIFGMYHYPIITYSKQEIIHMAKQNGWEDFLAMTWFCYKPVRGKYPCGKCNPCKTATEEGVASSISTFRKNKQKLRKVFMIEKVKKAIKKRKAKKKYQ